MDHPTETRIAPPPSPPGAIERHHAQRPLREALQRRAAWIVAPAGYGKTELMVQWHRRCAAEGRRVAWLSLDADDADLANLVTHLLAALGEPARVEGPLSRRSALARLHAACPADAVPTVLFLDDVERLDGAHDDLFAAWIAQMPASLTLVLASRERPPQVESQCAAGLALEIDAGLLRMGFSEARRLLGGADPGEPEALLVPEDEVAALLARTEGWPLALRMARDHLRQAGADAAPLSAFAGRASDLARHLTEAMLMRLPPEERPAAMAVACVPSIDARLLEHLTGWQDGAERLARWERRHLLLAPLDAGHRWLRLHPLLAQFMQERLREQHPGEVEQTQRLAARWFAGHGRLPEALRLARAAGDAALVAELLDAAGAWRMALDGRLALLRSHLPPLDASHAALFRSHPRLLLAGALLAAKSPEPSQAQAWLNALPPPAERDAGWADEARMVAVIVGWYLDQPPPGGFGPALEALRATLADDDALLVGACANMRALTLAGQRLHTAALAACDEALRRFDAAGLAHHAIFIRFVQAQVALDRGRTREALAALGRLREGIEAAVGPGSDMATLTDVLRAQGLALRGQAAQAQALLATCLPALAEQDTWLEIQWAAHAAECAIHALSGDEAGWLVRQQAALDDAAARGRHRLHGLLRTSQAAALARAGRPDEAQALLDQPAEPGTDRRGTDAAALAAAEVALARWQATAGDDRPLRTQAAVLASLAWQAGHEGCTLLAVQAQLLAARCWQALGDELAGQAALSAALQAALPGHLMAPLMVGHAALAPWLPALQTRAATRVPNAWMQTVSQAWRHAALQPTQAAAGAKPAATAVTLSAREREVASMLVRGLSNKLMARELGLTERTVKFHRANLFGKLGVHRREDALERLARWEGADQAAG